MIMLLPRRELGLPEELPLDHVAQRVLDGEVGLLDVLGVVGRDRDHDVGPHGRRAGGAGQDDGAHPDRAGGLERAQDVARRGRWWVIPIRT